MLLQKVTKEDFTDKKHPNKKPQTAPPTKLGLLIRFSLIWPKEWNLEACFITYYLRIKWKKFYNKRE